MPGSRIVSLSENTTKDDYRPRKHDHLVEPMFGGLGVEDATRPRPQCYPEDELSGSSTKAAWSRLWRWLVSLVRPSRPASGP